MSAAACPLLAEEAADARPHASANNAHLHAAIVWCPWPNVYTFQIKVATFPWRPEPDSVDPDLRLLCQESRDLSHTEAGLTGA